ncbi:DMT family transporter [Clostridium cylindrosporum]|uniref:EamA domain-containing protein n=1 Tax=Clostridium cylindrosporum DSM 605 TaxID=1121307 RepID=A0A0J8FZB5_CLOCY|nr:DMT family transporter [Clostridium cylindrosporum]KMT20951.1 hypothetical protein CLCY_1c01850 [Clostridium cylindrosporum DSM 605]
MDKAKVSLIAAMTLFGSIGIFVRNINATSSEIALARGVLGSLFLFLVVILSRKKFSWEKVHKNIWLLGGSGIVLALNWILLFQAYKYTTISNATICYYFAPIIVMFLSPLILKERLNIIKVLCILAAMVGMFCIVGVGESGTGVNNILGIVYGLSAAAIYASIIILNKFLKDISGMERTLPQLLISSVLLFIYLIFSDGINFSGINNVSIVLLVILGVVHTGFAYLLYFSSVNKLSSQTIATFSYIDPISAIIMSSIFFGEAMSLSQIIGGILILGSTFVYEIYGTKLLRLKKS